MASAADIENFTSITGAPKGDAIKWLSAHNGNVESAIGAYFDGLNNPLEQHDAMKWDESPFHSDKTVYGPQTQKQASFNVHSHDTLGPRVFDGTISRPPSRVSDRGLSPGPGGNSKQLSVAEREEEDINKAMAMSLNLPGQETGVTDVSGQHFGPARQLHYDTSQWAMSLSGPRAQEILHNPAPELRKRELDQPAFLKPALGKHVLPPLLTILHAIPMAREAFLFRAHSIPDYGQNSDWWDGVAIEIPKVLELDKSYEQDPDWDEILVEAQRLMAFLDETDRAYGSAEALLNMSWIKEREDPVAGFLELWRDAAAHYPQNEELRDVFCWNIQTEGELKEFPVIDITSHSNIQSNPYYTLYSALDDSLWSAFRATDTDETQIERIPEVLIFKLHVISPPHGIKVPLVWYADRYLKENVRAVRQMRLEKESYEDTINKLKAVQGQLTDFSSPSGTLDSNVLLGLAKIYLEEEEVSDLEIEEASKLIDVTSMEALSSTSGCIELAKEMSNIVTRVTAKIEDLEKSQSEALRQLHELSKLYTEPSENPDEPPHYRYTLRGVSTDYRTTYVLRNPSGDSSDDLLVSEASPDWQWWKITYTSGDANPISYSKVREVEVLKAVKDGGHQVLVVYASEKAAAYQEKELPPQLKSFIHRDNQAFAAEFEKASSKPATPTKRKANDTYDEDKSSQGPDPLIFPNYYPDPVSSTSPSKRLNGGATTTTRDLSHWDNDPPSYDAAIADSSLNDRPTELNMSSPPRNQFTSINESTAPSNNPFLRNTAKSRATTTKNNPFLKPKHKAPGFDDMLPVSLISKSPPPESRRNAFTPPETTVLDSDDDVIMQQPDHNSAGAWNHAAEEARTQEMQERTANLGVLRGVGRGFNPFQAERQVPELIMDDDVEDGKGG